MGEIVKADLDALRALSTTLSTHAGTIDGIIGPIKTSVEAVVMPDAGLDETLANINAKLGTNIGEHATNVRNLSTGAATAANTYEAVDGVFKAQLDTLTGTVE